MDNSKPAPGELLELCDSIHPEDGVSPKQISKRNQRSRKTARSQYRQRQLCRQVRMGVDDALSGDCADPLLSDLVTIDVRPVAGSSVLEATLVTSERDIETINQIQNRLVAAKGWIRSSVALVITRKRVPEIRFRVIADEMK